ncbi:hypothetical protein ACRTDU_03860 [Sunxiuqinia elliptica]
MSLIPTFLEQGLQPDIFEEIEFENGDETTYVGFFKNADASKCMIYRIQKVSQITSIMFPHGINDFVFAWDDRKVLDYSYKR